MSWDHDAWIAAWGWNAPMIVGGTGDEKMINQLPKLPPGYGWMVTRELTGEHPTYMVMLHNQQLIPLAPWELIAKGKIDKKMYGEAGVVELARRMKEKLDARSK